MSEITNIPSKRHSHAKTGTDPDLLALGEQLRVRRCAIPMTQAALALVTGVGREFIMQLENGQPGCAIGKVMRIIKALGLTVQVVEK